MAWICSTRLQPSTLYVQLRVEFVALRLFIELLDMFIEHHFLSAAVYSVTIFFSCFLAETVVFSEEALVHVKRYVALSYLVIECFNVF
jgi:hypothetical protein